MRRPRAGRQGGGGRRHLLPQPACRGAWRAGHRRPGASGTELPARRARDGGTAWLVDFGSCLGRLWPADASRATKAGLNHQAVEGSDEKNVDAPQSVVAVDNRGHNETRLTRRRVDGTEDRYPEIQMLVVLSKHDLSRACAVDLEQTDSALPRFGAKRHEVFGGLEPESGDECISNPHEAADPGRLLSEDETRQQFRASQCTSRKLDRVCVGQVHRFVGPSYPRLRRQRYCRYAIVFVWHGGERVGRSLMSNVRHVLGRKAKGVPHAWVVSARGIRRPQGEFGRRGP
jgi:hypothetical protein